jgi:hypothetical protein
MLTAAVPATRLAVNAEINNARRRRRLVTLVNMATNSFNDSN